MDVRLSPSLDVPQLGLGLLLTSSKAGIALLRCLSLEGSTLRQDHLWLLSTEDRLMGLICVVLLHLEHDLLPIQLGV